MKKSLGHFRKQTQCYITNVGQLSKEANKTNFQLEKAHIMLRYLEESYLSLHDALFMTKTVIISLEE